MTFDIQAAIADLDTRGLGYADDGYRSTMELAIERNPELAAPLRRITDVLEDVEAYGNPRERDEERKDAQDEQKRLYDLVDEAEARFAQLRDMALILLRIDVEKRDDGLVQQLASKADEAQDYIQKRKDL